jgi:sarcosine oxidase subunit beta
MAGDIPQSAEIVVIGGGVMGASTAYHLALAGAKDVLLLERDTFFGQGATGRCAGGVRYQFSTEVNVRLSIASLAMIERFTEEIGQDPFYRKCGYLFALTNEQDVEAIHRHVAMQNKLGVATQWMSGDDVRQRLPMMRFEDALAASFHDKDGLADPNSIVMGYINRGRDLGVKPLTEVAVQDIDVQGNRVVAVDTSAGDVACSQVINAAGPWAAQVGAMAGVEIPITALRRQWVSTTALPDLPPDFPFVIDFAQALYFHPEGEGVLTGMTNPHQKPGFDQNIDREWELTALEAAAQRMPMLEQAGRLTGLAGLYEDTPDSHPIFGPTPIEGFWLVAGFSGHGFMHGPIAGKLMAEFLLEGKARSVDVSMLDFARFVEGRSIQEYHVV